MPPAEARSQFAIRHGVRLHWAGWDGEFVVFNESSGQTHQLDALRAFVLNLLVESPKSWDELLREVRGALHADDEPTVADTLAAVLDAFRQHGLVDTLTA